jgi:hypothetical protein
MRGCGPGTRATCSAVLSGALEAYPLLGTTPGALGGGAGGGLRAIFWWVAVYFSGSVLLLELVASKLRARFSQISSFCYCVQDNTSAGLCPSFVDEVRCSSAQPT